ncbi:MAG: D-alanyl-D-alanine carboxypeptidase family protein [Clostridiales bacterium]
MKKIFTVFSIIICIVLINTSSVFSESKNNLSEINAAAYILMDRESGQILYQNNSNSKIYPASTTKIMTAIIAIENNSLDKKVTASQNSIDSIGNGGMNIGINSGESITIHDLLKAVLISSANECAHILAETTFDDYDKFIKAMNTKAKSLGAKNTHFVNPSGMHDPNHYTTANDLALIAQYAMNLKTFKEIVSKEFYNLSPTNKHDEWPTLYTKNTFLRYFKESDYYSKITGIKTGYTSAANFNLVGSAINDNEFELISVVNGVETRPERDNYTKILLEYGFENFDKYSFIKKNQSFVKNLEVSGAKDNKTLNLVAEKKLSLLLPIDRDQWNLEIVEKINTTKLNAPIKKGDNFGYIQYKNNGKKVGKINIVAYKTIQKSQTSKFKDNFIKILRNPSFITIISIVLLIAAILITPLVLKKFYFKKKVSSVIEKFRLK